MENMDKFKKDDFTVKVDELTKLRIVVKVSDELTKNHRTGEKKKDIERGFMCEDKSDPTFCPVENFITYKSRLNPDNPWFFQDPKPTVVTDGVWYTKKKLGYNRLSSFMPMISEKAELSQVYTNHDIRATGITVLSRLGFKSADIMEVSGHRSVSSLTIYQKTSREDRLKCSIALMQCMHKPLSKVDGPRLDLAEMKEQQEIEGNISPEEPEEPEIFTTPIDPQPAGVLGNPNPSNIHFEYREPSPRTKKRLIDSKKRFDQKRAKQPLRDYLLPVPTQQTSDPPQQRYKPKIDDPPLPSLDAPFVPLNSAYNNSLNMPDPYFALRQREIAEDAQKKRRQQFLEYTQNKRRQQEDEMMRHQSAMMEQYQAKRMREQQQLVQQQQILQHEERLREEAKLQNQRRKEQTLQRLTQKSSKSNATDFKPRMLRLLPDPTPKTATFKQPIPAQQVSISTSAANTSKSSDEEFVTPPSTPNTSLQSESHGNDSALQLEEMPSFSDIDDNELLDIAQQLEAENMTMAPITPVPPPLTSPRAALPARYSGIGNTPIDSTINYDDLQQISLSQPVNQSFQRFNTNRQSMFNGCQISEIHFHVHKK